MNIIIWHNPRCTKSRQTLQLLRDRGIDPQVVEYLKNPPSKDDIQAVLAMLEISAADLVRKSEPIYRELGLSDETAEEDLLDALRNYPALIERPVVINNDKAIIGRPPEAVLSIL